MNHSELSLPGLFATGVLGVLIGSGFAWSVWGASPSSAPPPAQPRPHTPPRTTPPAPKAPSEPVSVEIEPVPPAPEALAKAPPEPVAEQKPDAANPAPPQAEPAKPEGKAEAAAPQEKKEPAPAPAPDEPLIAATFEGGAGGFQFVADAFLGTNNPAATAGAHLPKRGFNGDGLSVRLGFVEQQGITGLSGGWRREFKLDQPVRVVLSFQYILRMAAEYEAGEYAQAMLSVDDKLIGAKDHEYLARLTGDGNDGPVMTTGWQQIRVGLGELSAGTHAILIGCHNNERTASNETVTMYLDNVTVTRETEDNKAPPVIPPAGAPLERPADEPGIPGEF